MVPFLQFRVLARFCVLGLALVSCFGCSSMDELYSRQEMTMETKATEKYKQGTKAIEDGEYLLARDYYKSAATLAISKQLHKDALAGIARSDELIKGRR